VRKLLLLSLAVAACAGAVHVGSAQAISACGTITASTTLSADCAAPLIVGANGITINLGGHNVVCDTPELWGILIPLGTSNVAVQNGTVRGGASSCVDDVNVGGDSNRLVSLRAFDASNQGFTIGGDSNTLQAVTGNFNANDGVIVFGDHNLIRQATLAGNGDDGAGVFLGTGNTIMRSRSLVNGDKGIIVGGSGTVVEENQSFDNDIGIYFSDGSTGSIAVLNQTYLNDEGIWINSTSNHNTVVFNGSYANFDTDMLDDNTNCDTNLWFNNLFSTSNQGCIK
jgi:hypothetical protein